MSRNLLNKIKDLSFLSRMFDFVARKKAVKITLINKKLSSELNLSIDEYLLEEKYRKIIQRANASINDIFYQSFKCYKEIDFYKTTFPELVQRILKYMKFLLDTKKVKYYTIIMNSQLISEWPHYSFIIEAMRYLKRGISFINGFTINFRYYDILKDAINNLEEIHSVTNYSIYNGNHKNENLFILYYEMFDWEKVRCINFSKVFKKSISKMYVKKNILIPNNANFRKIIIDCSTSLNTNDLTQLMSIHGEHIEYLKLFHFRDFNVNLMFYQNFKIIKKVKYIQCERLTFPNFLIFFKNNLSDIKVLVLDGILENISDNLAEKKQNYYITENLLHRLNNLEKLEMNFRNASNTIFKLLSILLVQNPNLQKLKIGLELEKIKIKQSSSNFMDKFLSSEKELEDNYLKDFYTFIKNISSLKKLSSLELNFSLNDKMTQIVSTFLNLGPSLKNLSMIHSKKLNVSQLLMSHPNLIRINLCLNNDENSEDKTKEKFNYEFSRRPWKSIVLKNYPLNNSFVDAIIAAKNSLNDLTLENTVNVCEKSDAEVNNILLAIKYNKI